jgi:two-component system, OmpR family, sensor kinase
MSIPGLRSLRNRLAVVFGLIVMGAIGTVYLSVTPRLQERLTEQKLTALKTDAARTLPQKEVTDALGGGNVNGEMLARLAGVAASRSSAEVLVLQRVKGDPPGLSLAEDSQANGGVRFEEVSSLALRALETGEPQTAVVESGVGRQALAAQPVRQGRRVVGVAVFADALADVEANVALIRRQILISGGAALVIAILAGYLVARALSLRVKRLERAAAKVASGDFSDPIRADSDDELGQLATAFGDMQQQLARLDYARKQFIASASHELRTPIFSLGGFLELLADEELDEETRRTFLEQLQGQVERMRTLATELLDLSRLEAGALELRPEPTDIGQLAREVAAEFTPAAQRHDAEVMLELGEEPIELECDPERTAQVLRILLDNALVHTPAGTGVRVLAARDNGHVRLEVSDGGPGIKRQNMPHIFEPFFTSNDEAQGAGLGLAIARELADRMHGELSVRSVPGRTTFSLELPA